MYTERDILIGILVSIKKSISVSASNDTIARKYIYNDAIDDCIKVLDMYLSSTEKPDINSIEYFGKLGKK